jgi:hypothetical protein
LFLQPEKWNTTPPPVVFEQIISMTDYERLCSASVDKARADVKGISLISMMKITLSENGKDINLVCKEDLDKKGWLPRPVLPIKTSAWNRHFKNDQTSFAPQKIIGDPRPTKVRYKEE